MRAQAAFGVGLRGEPTARLLSGQAALDFMMTYGWALLVIAIVASIIATLNIVDFGMFFGTRAAGFSQIKATAWQLMPNGTLVLAFKNNAGIDINITNVDGTMGATSVQAAPGTLVGSGGTSANITLDGFGPQSPAASYGIRINLTYVEPASGFSFTDSGTVYGKVA